jgi:Beta-lactamase class C and other penicillin binding proteins
MDRMDEKTSKLISAAVLALTVIISGWLAFANIGRKPPSVNDMDNLDYELYEPPFAESQSVSYSDLNETQNPSPSDLPVESEAEQQPETPAEEKVTLKLVRIKSVANLRAGEKENSEKITALRKGIELELLSEGKQRYQVRYAGTKSGWVSKSCCEVIEKEVTVRHFQKYTSGNPIDLKGTKEASDLNTIFKNHITMGASVAIIKNGQVAYHLEYGYANKEKKVKVSENTKFRIASVSKVATSMLAMGAVDDGKLDLDQNLTDLMGFKFYNPSYSKRPVTARMLLTHTAGIRDNDKMFDLKIQKVTHNKDFYASPPGTVFLYTNLGMGLAGAVVEKSTGKTISQFARDRFFDGMGIDAAYNAKYLNDSSLIADCYVGNNIVCNRDYLCREQETGGPGETFHLGQGGLLISSKDLAAFFSLLLNNGRYNGTQYLSENAVSEMLKVQPVETKSKFEQCIGIRKSKELIDGRELYYHNGAAYGIFSLMALDPSDNSGIVVITSGADAQRLSNTVFNVCDDVMDYCYAEILKE